MRLVVPGSTSRGVVGGQRGHFSTGWFACDTRASLCVIDSPKNISWAVSKLVSLSTSLNFVAFTSFGTLQRQPAPYSPNRREGSFSETRRHEVVAEQILRTGEASNPSDRAACLPDFGAGVSMC